MVAEIIIVEVVRLYGAPFVKILFIANPYLFSLFVNNGQPSKIYL